MHNKILSVLFVIYVYLKPPCPMTESAVILIAALRADAAALILVAAAEAADCIVLLARQIGSFLDSGFSCR